MAEANEGAVMTARLVTQWPGAWLLDADGRVLTQGPAPGALASCIGADAGGRLLLEEVLGYPAGGRLAQQLATFLRQRAQNAGAAPVLDAEEALRLRFGRVTVDVRIRLRGLSGLAAAILATVEDDTARKTTERALTAALGDGGDAAMFDAETGLYGRRQLDFLLPIELRRGQRYGLQTTLLGIRPEVGVAGQSGEVTSAILRELGHRIQAALRQTDVVFHLRPGSLHVVLTHTDADAAQVAAQRVHAALAAAPLEDGRQVRARVAMAASGTPDSPPPALAWARELLAEVDRLLTA